MSDLRSLDLQTANSTFAAATIREIRFKLEARTVFQELGKVLHGWAIFAVEELHDATARRVWADRKVPSSS